MSDGAVPDRLGEALHGALIGRLAGDLRPVKRLLPPWQRALLWLAAALWAGLLVALFADLAALRLRMASAPDLLLSELGAVLTAVSAGWAALQTSVPGRSAGWAWLPLPAAALWVGASTAGCLRQWFPAGVSPEPVMHPVVCVEFLLLVCVPLAGLLGWLLARACPLRPGLTAGLAGLASAAAGAALLALVHPFDATADDLAVHLVAVLCVVAGTRHVGIRAFR